MSRNIYRRDEENNRLQKGYLSSLASLLLPFAKLLHSNRVSYLVNELMAAIRAEVHEMDRERFCREVSRK